MNKKLDYKRMIEEIDKLTQSDFLFDMDCHNLPKSKPYTQEEAQEMCDILMKIYSIAHCNTCTACQSKWLKAPKLKVVKFGHLKLPSGIILE